MPVRVTKVTIEYEAGGKPFTVVLDPTKVDAILLNRTDVDRLKIGQVEAGKNDPSVKAPIEHKLSALDQIPATLPGTNTSTFIMSAPTSAASATTSPAVSATASSALAGGGERGLWWHTIECAYFHPD